MSQWQNSHGSPTNEEPKDPVLEKTENNQVKTEPTIWEGCGPSVQEQSRPPMNTLRQSYNSAFVTPTAMNNFVSFHNRNLNVMVPDMKLPAVGNHDGPSAQQQGSAPANPPSKSYNSVYNPLYTGTAMNNYTAYHGTAMNNYTAYHRTAMHNYTAYHTHMKCLGFRYHGNIPELRGKIKFTGSQTEVLQEVFRNNTRNPDFDLRRQLASQLKLPEDKIQTWFKNRRAECRQQKKLKENIKPKKMSSTTTTMLQSTQETPSKPDSPDEGELATNSKCIQRTVAASYPLTNTKVPSSCTQNHGLSSQYGNLAMGYLPHLMRNLSAQTFDIRDGQCFCCSSHVNTCHCSGTRQAPGS